MWWPEKDAFIKWKKYLCWRLTIEEQEGKDPVTWKYSLIFSYIAYSLCNYTAFNDEDSCIGIYEQALDISGWGRGRGEGAGSWDP